MVDFVNSGECAGSQSGPQTGTGPAASTGGFDMETVKAWAIPVATVAGAAVAGYLVADWRHFKNCLPNWAKKAIKEEYTNNIRGPITAGRKPEFDGMIKVCDYLSSVPLKRKEAQRAARQFIGITQTLADHYSGKAVLSDENRDNNLKAYELVCDTIVNDSRWFRK